MSDYDPWVDSPLPDVELPDIPLPAKRQAQYVERGGPTLAEVGADFATVPDGGTLGGSPRELATPKDDSIDPYLKDPEPLKRKTFGGRDSYLERDEFLKAHKW
jgi:hypothetical protein